MLAARPLRARSFCRARGVRGRQGNSAARETDAEPASGGVSGARVRGRAPASPAPGVRARPGPRGSRRRRRSWCGGHGDRAGPGRAAAAGECGPALAAGVLLGRRRALAGCGGRGPGSGAAVGSPGAAASLSVGTREAGDRERGAPGRRRESGRGGEGLFLFI